MYTEIYEKLSELFAADIKKKPGSRADECSMYANPAKIPDISTYLYTALHYPLVSMFANDETALCGQYAIYYVFSDEEKGVLVTLITLIEPADEEFLSISRIIPAAALYEREIHDMFGLTPVGHPHAKRLVFHSNWPDGEYPLRKSFDGKQRLAFAKETVAFTKVSGEGVFEIPVGPVHAGIIEPGHFRFSVAGEPIIHLEAQLYYVHKGIEKMSEGQSIERCLYVSERISGDETFANSFAYCRAIEKIANVQIPLRAEYIRVVFAELERLTSHLGDLAGICLDTAYGFAAFQFRMMRGWSYLIADELCGMRFLRGVNKLGGVRKDFTAGRESAVTEQLKRIKRELTDTAEIMKSNSMFIDRVENTGILSQKAASDLHAVGPAARASGVRSDVRKSFPGEAYKRLDFTVPEHNNGDVNCRMNVKIEECFASIDLIFAALESMPSGKVLEPVGSVAPYMSAFGITESPRGENIHWIMTGENNTIFRYKIRTPSFCNWPAVCHAVKGNIVPDFPLINKSFNLSYAGNDL